VTEDATPEGATVPVVAVVAVPDVALLRGVIASLTPPPPPDPTSAGGRSLAVVVELDALSGEVTHWITIAEKRTGLFFL
jgi:hypothetical protein